MSILDMICPKCEKTIWVAIDDPRPGDYSGIDPDGFKCCLCEHVFPVPEMTFEDMGFDTFEQFLNDSFIFDTAKTPNDALGI